MSWHLLINEARCGSRPASREGRDGTGSLRDEEQL